MKSFTLPISDDTNPEVVEYIFFAITSVQLDRNSVGEKFIGIYNFLFLPNISTARFS